VRALRAAVLLAAAVLVSLPAAAAHATDRLSVTWHPLRPKVGDVAWVHVRGVSAAAVIAGSVADRSLLFFPYDDGQAALVGLDLEVKPGVLGWRLAVEEPGRPPRAAEGSLPVGRRDFTVQRLTLPSGMVDLDPETERRAVSETERMQTLYRTVTPERLWRGPFTRPVSGTEPGTGFGSRRVINGKPRAPHTGIDFAADRGTPVMAVNGGRVALLGEFFFPGRLVILDHGLGLYTLYFHLDTVAVSDGERVERGQTIGTVGATGRATGPHLHFGAHMAGARIDPAALLNLRLQD
jgi:murein DD-endopeptidase MepM/ murein hydrolase activator NlpD